MRARLAQLLGAETSAKDLWVGTFHATCARLLRRHRRGDRPSKNFVIYDTDDQKRVVARALRELDLDEKRYPPRTVLARIDTREAGAPRPGRHEPSTVRRRRRREVYPRYEEQLQGGERRRLRGPHRQGRAPARGGRRAAPGTPCGARFDYVLVDEFQDTNAAQYRFLRGPHAATTGTSASSATTTSRSTGGAAPTSATSAASSATSPSATVVKLEQNYRSTARIVAAALGVIAPLARARAEGAVDGERAGRARSRSSPPATSATRRPTSSGVIRERATPGVDPKEIAVFYRMHAQSRVLEEALRAVERAVPDRRRARSSTSAPRSRTRSRTCACS